MSRKSTVPYGHVTVSSSVLGTAVYGLARFEAAEIEARSDGLCPGTQTCDAVAALWEDGHQENVTMLIGVVCSVLRGRPMPGGVGRVTHGAVIDAFGVELSKRLPDGAWPPIAEHLHREVPRYF
jgi:hypothetical protein